MVKYHLALILASLAIAGCSGLKEFEYRKSQRDRARDAWKVAGTPRSGADYKDGWQTGYYDLSMGSDGQVPPVPPKKYWSSKYQNPEGQMAITDWYAGYQDGVIAAEQVGEFEWQLVPSSGAAALPHATITDYPTFYGSPPTGENARAEQLPTASSAHRQLPHAPQQQLNDAIATNAQPPLDLRTLTGRPSAPTIASQPMRRAIPAPPAPRRVFERVPQPARELPLATNNWENGRPAPTLAPMHEPSPAISPEQYLASQLESVEVSRNDDSPAAAPQDLNLRHSDVTIIEQPRQAFRPADDELQSTTTENSVTRTTPTIIAAEPFSYPPMTGEVIESRSVLRQPSTSDQPLAGKSIADETPNIEVKPSESKLHRSQVVSRQPIPPTTTRNDSSLVAPRVTATSPMNVPHVDDVESKVRSITASPRATVSTPTPEMAQSFRESEHSSGSLSDRYRVTARESKPDNQNASPPTPKVAELVTVPATPTPDKPTAETSATTARQSPEPTGTTVADSQTARDSRIENVVKAPRPSRTHRPIVVAAQPIQVPTYIAANRMPVPSIESLKPAPLQSADNTKSKDASIRPKPSIATMTGRPNEVPTQQATPQLGATESVVKMAEPFQLDSSGNSSKPIVVSARPLRLSEASTTRR